MGCPVLIGLQVLTETVEKYRHLHADPEAVLGAATLTAAVVTRLHELAGPCDPSIDNRGQLVCSLSSLANDVLPLAFGPNLQAGFAVQLGAVSGEGKSAEVPGLFL